MSAIETFVFDEYLLRPAGPKDLALAEDWTEADDWHRANTPARFWLQQGRGVDSWLLKDKDGPIYFARLKMIDLKAGDPGPAEVLYDTEGAGRCVRLDVQFMPAKSREAAIRIRAGIQKGLAWLLPKLEQAGVSELYFDSKSETLIRFCVIHLGFEQQGERLRKMLSPETAASRL